MHSAESPVYAKTKATTGTTGIHCKHVAINSNRKEINKHTQEHTHTFRNAHERTDMCRNA
jgi:hypothetical protein